MQRILRILYYVTSIHLFGLLMMGAARLILFLTTQHESGSEISYSVQAFVRGLWIDNTLACYITILPLIFLLIVGLSTRFEKRMFHVTGVYFAICYLPVLLIAVADIPYYHYFHQTIDSSIFAWTEDTSVIMSMIINEKSYWAYMGLALIFPLLFGIYCWYRSRIATRKIQAYPVQPGSGWKWMLMGLVAVALCVIGIRGRFDKRPLQVNDATFCKDAFLNQLGVTPALNLLFSTMESFAEEKKKLQWLDEATFNRNCINYFGESDDPDISPIYKKIQASDSTARKKNVVIIFMESMLPEYLSRFGQKQSLTPFLDSLYMQSLSFTNCYSTGKRTNTGLMGTLYSFPSLFARHTFRSTTTKRYSGLPTVLQENGYETMFFMPHRRDFDDLHRFLPINGFQDIYSEEDYPKEEVTSCWGVPDGFLYQYGLATIHEKAQSDRPFFAVLLSVSNHPPYVIPANFKPRTSDPRTQIVEYADQSLKDFFQAARKEPWFDNTLFVLVGDHGHATASNECELPQSFNHVPLLIYGTGIQPEEKTSQVNQIDIQPMVLDLLNISYAKNNLGVNVLHTKRPYNFYSSPDILAVRDSSHLFLYQHTTKQEYCYRLNGREVTRTPMDSLFADMKEYGFTMFQLTDYLIRNNKTVNSRVD